MLVFYLMATDCWPAISTCRIDLQEALSWLLPLMLVATEASLQSHKVVPSNWIRADDENGRENGPTSTGKRWEEGREAGEDEDRIHKAITRGRKWVKRVGKSSSRTTEWRASADEISLPTCPSSHYFFLVVFSAFFNFFGERTQLKYAAQLAGAQTDGR